MRSSFTVAAIVGAYILIVFVAFRFVIPSLINMQNDGAIALAILFAFAVAGLPFAVCPLIAALNEENTDED